MVMRFNNIMAFIVFLIKRYIVSLRNLAYNSYQTQTFRP